MAAVNSGASPASAARAAAVTMGGMPASKTETRAGSDDQPKSTQNSKASTGATASFKVEKLRIGDWYPYNHKG